MVDSLRIETGVKRILINDDPNKFIEFDPDDIVFAEKFYELFHEFKTTEKDFMQRAEQLDANKEVDELGMLLNAGERIQLMKDLCQWAKDKIDYLFGEGTSQMIFGDVVKLDPIIQFFNGVAPFFKISRDEKVQKYRKVVKDRKKIEEDKAAME